MGSTHTHNYPIQHALQPGTTDLWYGHDLSSKVKVDWQLLKEKRRLQATVNNDKENRNHKKHEYKVGDLVFLVEPKYERSKKAKLASPTKGPFEIIRHYNNGNVRIRRGTYDKDVSIHHLRLYHTNDN